MGVVLGSLSFGLVAIATGRWFYLAKQVSLPQNRTLFVAAWAGSAALGLGTLVFLSPGWVGGVPATLALVAGAFLTTLVAISPQEVGEGAISVGAKLPDFTARDENGDDFSSASLAGTPVLIKFFRGHW
jgi:hypothetical protein